MEPLNGTMNKAYDEWYESLYGKLYSYDEHQEPSYNSENEEYSDDGDYFEKERSPILVLLV